MHRSGCPSCPRARRRSSRAGRRSWPRSPSPDRLPRPARARHRRRRRRPGAGRRRRRCPRPPCRTSRRPLTVEAVTPFDLPRLRATGRVDDRPRPARDPPAADAGTPPSTRGAPAADPGGGADRGGRRRAPATTVEDRSGVGRRRDGRTAGQRPPTSPTLVRAHRRARPSTGGPTDRERRGRPAPTDSAQTEVREPRTDRTADGDAPAPRRRHGLDALADARRGRRPP